MSGGISGGAGGGAGDPAVVEPEVDAVGDPSAGDPALTLAVPSKGRLQENAAAFFARAGLGLAPRSGARDYRGRLEGVPDVEVKFLSAAEIAGQLAGGAAHLGVTGEDLIREGVSDADSKVELLTPLGFGRADVVVAVPRAWIDVRSMADLDEVASGMRARHGRRMRVATKYVNLTRRFLAAHGLADYRLVESLGATEGAPAAGSAEIIVDITTTGATLAANALKVLDDGIILRSEANLVAGLGAPWGPRARTALRAVLDRIAAEERARTTREVRGIVPAALDLPGLATPYGAALELAPPEGAAGEAVLRCAGARAFDLAGALVAAGGRGVSVRAVDYVLEATNPLAERLLARLAAAAT